MDTPDFPLSGRALLLSAGVPRVKREDIYQQMAAAEAVEEAVISLARAVFSAGGTLVMGGDPMISPLVAQVVREYLPPRTTGDMNEQKKEVTRGAQVEIYHPAKYSKLSEESAMRLEQQPGVLIHQVTSSPQQMHEEMIKRTDLAGMVCIGQKNHGEMEEEVAAMLKHKPPLPVYLLESTGDFTDFSKLPVHLWGPKRPERDVQPIVESFWRKEHKRQEEARERRGQKQLDYNSAIFQDGQGFVMPYGHVAQQIVAEISRPEQRDEQGYFAQ